VLKLLEKGDRKAPDGAALLEELPLFAAARPKPSASGLAEGDCASPSAASPMPSPLEGALAAINPDDLTPKAALEALYRLKEMAGKRGE
jgi:DNA mismatch repair protein MutS